MDNIRTHSVEITKTIFVATHQSKRDGGGSIHSNALSQLWERQQYTHRGYHTNYIFAATAPRGGRLEIWKTMNCCNYLNNINKHIEHLTSIISLRPATTRGGQLGPTQSNALSALFAQHQYTHHGYHKKYILARRLHRKNGRWAPLVPPALLLVAKL